MEFICDDNPHPCIPDGIYDAICIKHDKAYYYNSLKLFLHFKIIAPAEYNGTKIFLPFNMPNNGRVSQGSKYYKTWTMVNGWKKPSRNTEMKPRIFMKKVFKIKTCKVNPCHNGKEMPINHQYSKVKEIVEVVTGTKT